MRTNFAPILLALPHLAATVEYVPRVEWAQIDGDPVKNASFLNLSLLVGLNNWGGN